MEKLQNIQALRAVAAMMVMVSHFQFVMVVIREREPRMRFRAG